MKLCKKYMLLLRRSTKHRHDGRFITNYEALYYVEKAIYKYLKKYK